MFLAWHTAYVNVFVITCPIAKLDIGANYSLALIKTLLIFFILSPDEDFLLFTETGRASVHKYYLKGRL